MNGTLYSSTIKDHGTKPRNNHSMDGWTLRGRAENLVCGDSLFLYLKLEDGVIRDASFVGDGCKLFKASASLMTEHVKRQTISDAQALSDEFLQVVATPVWQDAPPYQLRNLSALTVARSYPARASCITLPWTTLLEIFEIEHCREFTEDR